MATANKAPAKKTAAKKAPAKAVETTSTRTSHKWTDAERQYLLDNIDKGRAAMIEGFRRAFPKFEGSNTAIGGRAYTLTHRSTDPAQRVTQLEAQIVKANEKALALKTELKIAKAAAKKSQT